MGFWDDDDDDFLSSNDSDSDYWDEDYYQKSQEQKVKEDSDILWGRKSRSSLSEYEESEEEIEDEIELMDPDEAREYLEDQGYDPEDFDL